MGEYIAYSVCGRNVSARVSGFSNPPQVGGRNDVMAKLLEKVRLTDSTKAMQSAGKRANALCESAADAADFARRLAAETALYDILLQRGEGKGKRFSGARSHDFADQMRALQSIVKVGNVPTWSTPAPAADATSAPAADAK